MKIQKSTRTLIPHLAPAHDFCRMRFGWYYRWHLWRWAKPVHYLTFIVYIIGISIVGLTYYQSLQPKPAKAAKNHLYSITGTNNLDGFYYGTDDGPYTMSGMMGQGTITKSGSDWILSDQNSLKLFKTTGTTPVGTWSSYWGAAPTFTLNGSDYVASGAGYSEVNGTFTDRGGYYMNSNNFVLQNYGQWVVMDPMGFYQMYYTNSANPQDGGWAANSPGTAPTVARKSSLYVVSGAGNDAANGSYNFDASTTGAMGNGLFAYYANTKSNGWLLGDATMMSGVYSLFYSYGGPGAATYTNNAATPLGTWVMGTNTSPAPNSVTVSGSGYAVSGAGYSDANGQYDPGGPGYMNTNYMTGLIQSGDKWYIQDLYSMANYYMTTAVTPDAGTWEIADTPPPTVTDGDPEGWTISGTVTFGGNGLSGVTVSVTDTSSSSVTTAANGTFTTGLLVAGTYNLSFSKTNYGFSPASYANISITNANITGKDATAVAANIISGSVAGTDPLSGGTVSYDGDYTIRTFTADGTLSVSDSATVDELIVAGGGGANYGGGGGGGVIIKEGQTLSPGTYPIVIGDGGAQDTNGENSTFNGETAIGGGAGGSTDEAGSNGGSGGGGGGNSTAPEPLSGGTGTVGQGNDGGLTSGIAGSPTGGGGGAGAAGQVGNATNNGGDGGIGIAFHGQYYGGGGGGAGWWYTGGTGGSGGGGNGAPIGGSSSGDHNGVNGLANTGGGGGARSNADGTAGVGGSGIVVIRYTYTASQAASTDVAFSASGQTTVHVTADRGGNYTSTPLLSGVTWTVTPTKDGLTFSPSSDDVALSGSDVADINFALAGAPPTGITISGTCKQYDESTGCADSETVKVAVNGDLSAETGTTSSGSWSISDVAVSSGDTVTVFIDGVADANEANAVTKYDGDGDITGVDLYEKHLSLGSADNQTLSNTDISKYDNSVSTDEDIFFDVDGSNNLTLPAAATQTDSDQILIILASNTWRPASAGGTASSVPKIFVSDGATATLDNNTLNVTGSGQGASRPLKVGTTGTFNYNTSTVAYKGSTATDIAAIGYYNLTLDKAGTTFTPYLDLTITNVFTINAGTFNASDKTITLSGSGTPFVKTGTFTYSTSTIKYTGSSATNVTGANYYNLYFDHSGTTFRAAAQVGIYGVLTVNAGTYNGGDTNTVLLGTSGTPFVINDTFSPGTGAVRYGGNNPSGNVTVVSTTYYYLTIGWAAEIYVAAGDITVNRMTIDTSTFDASDKTITCNGSGTGSSAPFYITGGGTFTASTSTIKLTGSSSSDVVAATYYNLYIDHAGTTFTAAGDITVSNVFTINAGTFSGSSKTITLSGSGTPFVKTGTFTASTSTVKYTGAGNTTITAATYYNLETSPSAASASSYTLASAGSDVNASDYMQITDTWSTGKNVYYSASKGFYIFWWGLSSQWEMNTSVAEMGLYYYNTNTAKDPNPPTTSDAAWSRSIGGGSPAPTVTFSAGSTYTYTFASGTININGAYTNGDGTHAVNTTADTNDPVLNIDGAFNNAASATFVASASATFSVAGNFVNNASATFTHSSGTLTIDGSGTQSLTSAGDAFNNVVVSNTAAEVSQADAATISGTLTINASAVYDINGQNITLTTLTNNGTFRLQGGETTVTITNKDTTHGTIEYNGTGDYSASTLIYGTAYYNLTFNGSGGKWYLPNAGTVGGDLHITLGTFSQGNNGVLTVTGTLYVDGGTYSVGNQGNYYQKLQAGNFNLSGGSYSLGTFASIVVTGTFTMSGGSHANAGWNGTTVGGDCNMSGGTLTSIGTLTFNGNTSTFTPNSSGYGTVRAAKTAGQTLNFGGNFTANRFYVDSGSINPGTTTLTIAGNDARLNTGGQSVYDLTTSSIGLFVEGDSRYSHTGTLGGSVYLSGTLTALTTATTSVTGTVLSSGVLILVDGAGANLSVSGSLQATARFQTVDSDAYIPAGTYGRIQAYNAGSSSHSVILGKAAGQTINITGNGTNNIAGYMLVTNDGSGNLSVDAATYNPTMNLSSIPGDSTYKGRITFSGTGAGTKTILAGNGTWTVGGDLDFTGGLLTAGNSTFILNNTSYPQTVTSNSQTFKNLTITNTNANGVTFADAAATSGTFTDTTQSTKLTFHSGSTYNFNTINITGGADHLITLAPSSTTNWILNATTITAVTYVSVSYSTNSGTIFCATYSNDGGNTSGWKIGVSNTCNLAIAGTITLGGSGFSGVQVTATKGELTRVGTSTSNGTYSIADCENGTWTLTPSKENYTFSPVNKSAVMNDAQVTGQDFSATYVPPSFMSGWLYRSMITINYSKVGTSGVSDFPVLINESNVPAAFWSQVAIDGKDIRITGSDGTTILKNEMVSIDTSGHTMEVWFKAPTLSNTLDSIFYIYWGNSNATMPSVADQQAVWSNGYASVWHMKDDTTSTIADSTGNGFTGTKTSANNPLEAIGLLGKGQFPDGSNDYIYSGSSASLNPTNLTVSAWVKVPAGASNALYDRLIEIGGYQNNGGIGCEFQGATSFACQVWAATNTIVGNTYTFTDDAWFYMTLSSTTSPSQSHAFYINGSQQGSTSTASRSVNAQKITIASQNKSLNNNLGKFYIDETRVSNVARSLGWTLTEYNNQNAPGTFYALADVEAGKPSAPTNAAIGSIDSTYFDVTWTDNSSDETGFKVYISTTPNADCSAATYPGSPDYTTAADATSQHVTGKSINSQYCAKVTATSAGGDSDPAYASPKYTLANVPNAPTVNATTSSSLTIIIDANNNPSNTQYAIYNQTTSQYLQADGTLGASAVWQDRTTWGGDSGIANTSLSVNTQYYYQVKSRNGDNTETSLSSASEKFTLANVPAKQTVTTQSSTSMTITISPNSNPSNTLYCIWDDGNYVNHSNGTLQVSPDWQTFDVWGGESGFLYANLGVNSYHYIRTKAQNGDGTETALSSSSVRYTFANLPSAPTVSGDYSVANGYHADITINVNNNPGGTNYWIQYSTNNSDYSDPAGMAWQTETSYTMTGLNADTQYWFKVKAKNSDGTATSYSLPGADVTPPAAPTNLLTSNICSTSASASWAASDDADNYTFSYGTDASATNLGETASITGTSHDLSNLSNGETYYWKVSATSTSNGTGAYSSIEDFTTGTCQGPIAPNDFNGSAASVSQINWTWSDTSDESGYYVQDTNHTNIQALPPGDIGWKETGLSVNTAYTRHINAYNDFGSNDSNQKTVYTLANVPSAPTVSASGSGIKIVIGKNSNPDSATRYAIYNTTLGKYVKHADGSTQDDPDWQLYADWGGASGFVNLGLSPNTVYAYQVKAENGDEIATSFSNGSMAYTLANVPGTPSLSAPSTSSLKVNVDINSNPGATTFAIYETTTAKYVQADGSLGASAVWQDYATWGGASGTTVSGLSLNTSYNFETKARNGDSTETAFSGPASKYTLANTPSAPTVAVVSAIALNITVNANSNPVTTTYAILENNSGKYLHADGSLGNDPVWQTRSAWGGASGTNNTGLSVNTSYTYKVMARNGDNTETSLSAGSAQTTLALDHVIITPSSVSMYTAGSAQFAASAYDNLNNAIPGFAFTWEVVNGGGSITADGLFTAGAIAGNFANTVKATTEGISGFASVVISESPEPAPATGDDTSESENTATGGPDISVPTPKISLPARAVVDTNVEFDASGSRDNVGVTKYLWDFGDGTSAEGSKATHSYHTINRYRISLTIEDKAGNKATSIQDIDIVPPQPILTRADSAATIVTIEGEAYPNIEVIVVVHSKEYVAKTTSDNDGNFKVSFDFKQTGLAPGKHEINVYAEGTTSASIVLASDQAKYDAIFNLTDNGDLQVKVDKLEKSRNWLYVTVGILLAVIITLTILFIVKRRRAKTATDLA